MASVILASRELVEPQLPENMDHSRTSPLRLLVAVSPSYAMRAYVTAAGDTPTDETTRGGRSAAAAGSAGHRLERRAETNVGPQG